MTCIRLLTDRDARARANALGDLWVMNARSKLLKDALAHTTAAAYYYDPWHQWDHAEFTRELRDSQSDPVDLHKKPG